MSATSFFSHVHLPTPGETGGPDLGRRAVTISREPGCGAQEIAGKLAASLQSQGARAGAPWTIFDQNLMAKVALDPRLPNYLATCLPEDRKPVIKNILDEIFAGQPPAETTVRHAAETMLGLAEVGNVILLDGGGNIVTAQVPHVLHVRLVAPLKQRLERAQEIYGMSPGEAHEFCVTGNVERGKFVQAHYRADITDSHRYHLIINTAMLSYDAAAKQIQEALRSLETMPKSGDNWLTRDESQFVRV